ncbi:hypothetical protein, partial [Gracilibacillus saliphilus]|uniref:hypothetical protein n=1 Tax=Gracilibacillus saliphilus TaxID=543890 RepID=UPI001EE27CD7
TIFSMNNGIDVHCFFKNGIYDTNNGTNVHFKSDLSGGTFTEPKTLSPNDFTVSLASIMKYLNTLTTTPSAYFV